MQPLIRLATSQDAPGLARVHVDAWREAYRHILPVDDLEAQGHRGLSYSGREDMWRRVLTVPGGTWVAVVGDEVIGFVSAAANRVPEVPCDGELRAIYVHPSAHRRGIGRALLRAAVDDLVKQGFTSMGVYLFAENHQAKAFYAWFGAEFHSTGEYEVAGVGYPDERYVWNSLRDLQDKLRLPAESG